MMRNIILLLVISIVFSCKNTTTSYDATGTFEAQEVIVSAEASGKILQFDADEGATLKKDQVVLSIDPSNLQLQKEQALASVNAITLKQTDAQPQVDILREQGQTAEAQIATLQTQRAIAQKEVQRISNLFKLEAATAQQLDDIEGKVAVIDKQIEAAQKQKAVITTQIKSAESSAKIVNRGVTSEVAPMHKKIALIDDQLGKSTVKSPVDGTILTKYMQAGELAIQGKPLFKISDLSEMTLRAYVTGDQLPTVKIGQQVQIDIDDVGGKSKTYTGVVSWISDKAEFTPKTIQTKDERANLVYATKIKVKNDGAIKIGMYGEVSFAKPAK